MTRWVSWHRNSRGQSGGTSVAAATRACVALPSAVT
eukprot:CAMPEP_0114043650 /NCGR_PEP_ID=MMETSP1339-20121228/6717_1 /TAXON_ID=94617 /ORGANISM="Fibrocapsa japonica" /LENGTH=35 /assembly_acc=CAM_ASM_000762